MKKVLHGACLHGILIVASLIFCLPLFARLDRWGRGDWDQFTFRHLTPRLAMLRDHQLPLWNPYVNGGNVLLAHPHCGAFSPWYLPMLALDVPLAMRLQVAMFMILGTTGMAVLLRQWNVSTAGCLLGAVLLMMSAHFAMHVTEGHLEWCVLGLVPWILFFLVRSQRSWRFVVAGALLTASCLLHGSTYIMAVFVPILTLWAVLESIRTGSWRATATWGCMAGLALLLSAVALFPRLEFVLSNPRPTERVQQVAPAALPSMLLSPVQADLLHSTRDLRNPPDQELARCLDIPPESWEESKDWKWLRLDMDLSTTSDWTDVRFSGIPYVLLTGKPEIEDKTDEQVDALPLCTEGLAIKNHPTAMSQQPFVTVEESERGYSVPSWEPLPKATLQATMYIRRPQWSGLRVAITRGDRGVTDLVIQHHGCLLLDMHYGGKTTDNSGNRLSLPISKHDLLAGGSFNGKWCRIEAVLRTNSDWAKVEVADLPYLFQVESPAVETRDVRAGWTRPLEVRSPLPGKETVAVRAILTFPFPEMDEVRLKIHQGVVGRSRLYFKTLDHHSFPAIRDDVNDSKGERIVQYVLPREDIQQRTEAQPFPWRWQLDKLGMTYDWHEYGCYLTWVGLVLGLVGAVAIFRRRWPLVAVGGVAVLVALGASLPIDVWALAQQLPLYGSLQVSGRFLAALVFVLAICAGFGMDQLGRWADRYRGRSLRRILEYGLLLIVYVELLLLSQSLFRDIFVCPPRSVPQHEQFAQRYAEDDVRYAAMYSAHCPYAEANSGVLREYENIAIPRGKIRLASDPDYRGEAYLERGHGTARITAWTMSRVTVSLGADAADRIVLNQNYYPGWKAVRRDARGAAQWLPALRSDEGLVSLPVQPGDVEVELYYLPDSFIYGSIVSGLSLLGCLGLVLVTSGRVTLAALLRPAARAAAWCGAWGRSRGVVIAAAAVALNAPFLLCHPSDPIVQMPLARSLAINLVLLVVPGLPLAILMVRRGWLPRLSWLAVVAASSAVLVIVVAATHVMGRPPSAATIWNGTWWLANVALLASAWGGPVSAGATDHVYMVPGLSGSAENALLGKPAVAPFGSGWRKVLPWEASRPAAVGVVLFFAAYVAFFHGATTVVPAMEDHDYETQGTCYGLLTELKPMLLTDRKTSYYFAHPPLLHACVAGSLLDWGQFAAMEPYQAAWDRVGLAQRGQLKEPPVAEFQHLPNGWLVRDDRSLPSKATRHRIVGVDGNDYLVEPPLPNCGGRIPVEDLEVQLLYDRYRHEPNRLPTRTPNLFFAALAVALLGAWVVRTSGRDWLGLLAAAVYASNPEGFVRSCYGGYFAISQFTLIEMFLAVEAWNRVRSRSTWTACLLAGGFAALANHKLILMPAAVVLWDVLWPAQSGIVRRIVRALRHPLVLGFALGTALFWAYGLAVEPRAFWLDHVRTHFVDRLLHHNPLGYSDYPSIAGLWAEFWRHTGYGLLPLGLVAIALGRRRRERSPLELIPEPCSDNRNRVSPMRFRDEFSECSSQDSGDTMDLWLVWMTLVAVSFSLVDWRQTKHLMPLLLPLCMVPARWATKSRVGLIVVSLVFVGLLIWNLDMLRVLTTDFASFPITPAW